MALIGDTGVDAVVVASPDPTHNPLVMECLRQAKPVLCEKPLGTDVAQCKGAEKIVEAHPELIFQLGFMRRFDKSYAEAKRRVDAGDIGKVVLVHAGGQHRAEQRQRRQQHGKP